MTLFVLAITGFSEDAINQKQQQIAVNKELVEKLKEANIDAQVDTLTGDIKISDLELFDVGSYNLSPKGKAYLNKLVPIYINTIFSKPELISQIDNIIIQGHTDTQSFAGVKNPDEQYMRNMTLSLERANSVANYIFNTNYDKKYNDKLKKILVVEGKSYSEPILANGKEDYNKSRRVEMRLKTKKMDITEILFNGAQYDD
jgi:chemotaxis protein MotB